METADLLGLVCNSEPRYPLQLHVLDVSRFDVTIHLDLDRFQESLDFRDLALNQNLDVPARKVPHKPIDGIALTQPLCAGTQSHPPQASRRSRHPAHPNAFAS